RRGVDVGLVHSDSHGVSDYRRNTGATLRTSLLPGSDCLGCPRPITEKHYLVIRLITAVRLGFWRLRMNCHAINLRKFLFHAVLQRPGDLLDVRDPPLAPPP